MTRRHAYDTCPQCGAPKRTHGRLCRVCDTASRRAGSKTAERFWSFVERGQGCWEWRGTTKNGYGLISWAGRQTYAHRLAYELTTGESPAGLEVMHSCDNPPCVNPAHLRVGTHAENQADMARKGRAGGPGLPGERNPNAKLTADKVRELRRLRSEGWTYRRLATRYGMTRSPITNAAKGETWAHIR